MKTGILPAPECVSSSPAKPNADLGMIAPNFDDGSVLLRNAEGKFLRLVWSATPDGRKADNRRALPPGSYKLAGYHLVRKDEQKKEWFVWMNVRAGTPVEVKAGATLPLKVEDGIALSCKATLTSTGVDISAHIRGPAHAGLTIYKDGKRIPMRYKIVKRDGKDLAKGDMEYG